MRSLLSCVVVLCLLLAAGSARAGDPLPAEEPHWYGGRLLLADAAAVAVFAVGGSQGGAPVAVLGVGGWALGSPIVHATHGSVGRGVVSLALRVGLPLMGFMLGKSSSEGCWRGANASD